MCYTYDNLGRVTTRIIRRTSDNSIISTESFSYDAAGNVTSAPDSSFQYDTNNRLISFNGNAVSYDLDGNMLSNGSLTCTYDSANRLVSASGHTYTYNAEDVRIRNLCADEDTTYTYNTNAKLSMLLMKTTNGVVTKYVYGKGLIGEEVSGAFKTYHFDCRGSTIAITDTSGNITDTFAYDTYGKLISRTGISEIIFGYNGRDGVVTDDNGLIYMRARYYSPNMKRFINADIIPGKLSNAITLNRFAYANGNPVSFVDPFGLSAERCLTAANCYSTRNTTLPLVDSLSLNVENDKILKDNYNFTKAILVSDFNYGFPINITGHTQIYFYDSFNDIWYLSQYDGDTKANATVTFDPCNGLPQVCIGDVDGINRVVLEGDFNASAVLANQYAGWDTEDANKDIGRYNFLFHNCSDYTNMLLDCADIDGLFGQIASEGNGLISIPAVREINLSIAIAIDKFLGTKDNAYANNIGDRIDETLSEIGTYVDAAKEFLAESTNAIVDIGTSLYDGAKNIWNRFFG